MAITGVAAIGAAVAGGLGVSATVIAVAGLAITAVGLITKNSTLMKIGGGIGLGAGASALASGIGSAATGAGADATSSAISAPSVADASGAGSQAAGDVAEAASSTPDDLISGYTGASDAAGDSAGLVNGAGVQTVSDAAVNQAGAPLGVGGSQGAVAPVDQSLNGAANNSINNMLSDASPADANVATPNANVANVNPANANVANVNPANTNDITSNTTAASPVAPGATAPGSQTADAAGQTATTGSGAPMGFDASNAYTPVQNGLQAPSSWWQDTLTWMQNPKNNGLMQAGAGLIKGVGQGVGSVISANVSKQMTAQQQWEDANNTGAASVPTVNLHPTGAPSPYKTPAQIQQAASQATATATPAFNGIVNKARST